MADIRITPASSVMSFTSSLNYIEKITQDASGSLNLYGSGSTGRTEILSVDGNNGRLFTVSDDLSDSLFSVNTIAGLPVIEAFANNTVILGQYGQNVLVVTGSNVGIGTASPQGKLSVDGGHLRFNYANASTGYYFYLNHKGNQDGGILWTRDNSTFDWQMNNDTNGDFILYSYGAGSTSFLIKRSTGKIGIGSPSDYNEQLNVNNSISIGYDGGGGWSGIRTYGNGSNASTYYFEDTQYGELKFGEEGNVISFSNVDLQIAGGDTTLGAIFQFGGSIAAKIGSKSTRFFTTTAGGSNGVAYENGISTSNVNGEIAYWGGGSVTAGNLYYYDSSGNWTAANASAASTATNMLGIAAATGTASTVGMLLRGHARFTGNSNYTTPTTVGAPLYVKTTAGGFAQSPPNTSGQIVRIIGYVQSTSADQIYFCPDTTWVELA